MSRARYFGLTHDIATVDNESVADDETRGRAAKPQNRAGDLLRPAQPAERNLPHHGVHGLAAIGSRPPNHRRVCGARAHSVNADTSGAYSRAAHFVSPITACLVAV